MMILSGKRTYRISLWLAAAGLTFVSVSCRSNYRDTVNPTFSRYRPGGYQSNGDYSEYSTPYRTGEYQQDNGRWPLNWVPPKHLERRNRWHSIMIHHSALEFGDASTYDRAHKQKGWDGLGYHFVINNGHSDHGQKNGAIEVGNRWVKQREGAHCRVTPGDDNYWNEHSIGICLVGNFQNHAPSKAQMKSLVELVSFLQQRYHIPNHKIIGHRDVKSTACPGRHFSMYELKRQLGTQARLASQSR